MGIRTRRIAETDIAAYHRVLGAVAGEGRWLGRLTAPPLPDTESFVRDNIAAGNPHWVALAGDELVGWCDICRGAAPMFAHVGTLGMGVAAAWRGQGVGRALIERALDDAATRDFSRIALRVYAGNAAAMALYESVGFVREGRERHGVRLPGGFDDVCLMALVR